MIRTVVIPQYPDTEIPVLQWLTGSRKNLDTRQNGGLNERFRLFRDPEAVFRTEAGSGCG